MTTTTYVVLALGALLGSTVSGVTGVGGGMVYLPILVWGVGVKAAVPYLALLLLVGNISRAYFARSGINWTILKHFSLGAIPGAAIGALVYTALSASLIARALGVYLLAYVGLSLTKANWPRTATLRSISVMGFPAGFVSAVVGGSGPIIAPWLLRYGLIKETFLGTEAVGAALMHVVKLSIWGGAGMIGYNDILLLFPLGLLMIAGSFFGTRIVSRMRVRVFRAVLILTLAVVGIRFLIY
ncbi:sulfite exporter TauE/SafE family protein [candidate division KSB1 bacterium]|nr:MAG: sulfite exporter TauE/SafE family protein [candidate division KSB1 bacterium]